MDRLLGNGHMGLTGGLPAEIWWAPGMGQAKRRRWRGLLSPPLTFPARLQVSSIRSAISEPSSLMGLPFSLQLSFPHSTIKTGSGDDHPNFVFPALWSARTDDSWGSLTVILLSVFSLPKHLLKGSGTRWGAQLFTKCLMEHPLSERRKQSCHLPRGGTEVSQI